MMSPVAPIGPNRSDRRALVIQGSFPGGRPRFPQPATTSTRPAPVTVRPALVQPAVVPGRPGPILPAARPGLAAGRTGPILPHAARPGAVQPSSGNAFALPPGFQLRPSGLGQRLPEAVQQKMEAVFGARFADVRVHVGNEASSIGALAFTIGTDLYFAPGQYDPQTMHGQQLLGHELTHVVQQRAGRVRNPMGAGLAVVQDPALEAEAERMGIRAASAVAPVQAKAAEMSPGGPRPPGTPILPGSPGAAQPRRPGPAALSPILPGRPAGPSPVQASPVGTPGSIPIDVSLPSKVGKDSYRIVAGPAGQPIGSVMVHARGNSSIEVTDLKVDATHRGRGLGAMLMASAMRAGLQLGRSRVILASQDDGSGRLTSWYRRMGFEPAGVNVRGYPKLQATIGRVLANVAQARMAPAVADIATSVGRAAAGPILPKGRVPSRREPNGPILAGGSALQPKAPDPSLPTAWSPTGPRSPNGAILAPSRPPGRVVQPMMSQREQVKNQTLREIDLQKPQSLAAMRFLQGQVKVWKVTERGAGWSRALSLGSVGEAWIEYIHDHPDDTTLFEIVGDKDQVLGEVDAIQEYMEGHARAGGGGALFQSSSDPVWGMVSPQLPHGQYTPVHNAFQNIGGWKSPQVVPTHGGSSHPTVSTPGGTTLDWYGTYTSFSPGGTEQRLHMYGHGAEAHQQPLSPTPQTTIDTSPKLLPFNQPQKRAASQVIDLKLLNTWSGKRKGFTPDQNTAMSHTSAKTAAVAYFGDKAADVGWQWLHLIAFTLGGDTGNTANPNTQANLVCGTASANGHHLNLENFVKKLILSGEYQSVKLSAVAFMITGSLHIATKIRYEIMGLKPNKTTYEYVNTYEFDTLDSSKFMGSDLKFIWAMHTH